MDDDDDDIDIQTPRFRFRAKSHALALWMAGWVAVAGLFAAVIVLGPVSPKMTPPEARNGLSIEAVESEETAQIVGEMPAFQIVGDNGEVIVQDNSNANVRLWDAVIAVRGSHLPNIPQQIGDCVSHAYVNAAEYLICVELKTGPPREFHELFAPYSYGISRHQIGRGRIRGDGSCVAWAVKGGQEFGVLRADQAPAYSGAIARAWGKNGPPANYIEKAKATLLRTASQVRSADEVRDAICNGYPVPFGASNIGFERVVEKYGRLLADPPRGSWAHAQCVIGYDGSGSEPLFCVLNSWGPLAEGKSPIDGSPPGSYWITRRSMEFVARQGDAFAVSGFDGFKGRSIDFKVSVKPKREGLPSSYATLAP